MTEAWIESEPRRESSHLIRFNSIEELFRWADNNQIDSNHDGMEWVGGWRDGDNLEKLHKLTDLVDERVVNKIAISHGAYYKSRVDSEAAGASRNKFLISHFKSSIPECTNEFDN